MDLGDFAEASYSAFFGRFGQKLKHNMSNA
jgi:hypothetical protein